MAQKPHGEGLRGEEVETQWLSQGLNAKKIFGSLEFVDIDVLVVFALAVFVELDVVLETLVAVGVGFVDLGVLGQLAVGLETSGLIGGVLHDNVALLVLIVTKREKDDVTLVDPNLLPQL